MAKLADPFDLTSVYSDQRTLRFRDFIDGSSRWIRHCAVCGAFGGPVDLYCASCEKQLAGFANSGAQLRQVDYPFPVYSLFTWTAHSDRWLRPLLYALKGGRHTTFLRRWLAELSYRRTLASANPYRPIFVLPPRRRDLWGRRKKDHGWAVGQLLAQRWRSQTYDGLWPVGLATTKRQKAKSRNERFEMRFTARPEWVTDPSLMISSEETEVLLKEFQSLRTIVFADDVITSGATAFAAYMALGDPPLYEVWTIACRPKLALNPSI